MEAVIVVAIIFGTILGIVYLCVSARNKERLSLIEKGADASIFYTSDKASIPVWKIILVNLALTLTGIGIGIFTAGILHYQLDMDKTIAYPGSIFTLAGIGLFVGYSISKNLK
jgi:predicted Na+-dependent transporter